MKVTMLGLHATGKTTYAVGAYAEMRNKPSPGLSLIAVTESVATLNAGLERLAQRLPVERTNSDEAETIGLRVSTGAGVEHDLRVPDRSGEALRGCLHTREWDTELLEELREAESLLLFLRPAEVRPGEIVAEVAALSPPPENTEAQSETEVPWEPAMMPTDVAMVDALQELEEVGGQAARSVAVVISAWDEVSNMSPSEWLKQRLPLLAQYLESNSERFAVSVFGVSVQGGPFADPQGENDEPSEIEIDASEPDPWDRATCVDADGASVDLVAPLVWVLGAGG